MITKNIDIDVRAGEEYIVSIRVVKGKGRRKTWSPVDSLGRFTMVRKQSKGLPVSRVSQGEIDAIVFLKSGEHIGFTPEASESLGGIVAIGQKLYQNFANLKSYQRHQKQQYIALHPYLADPSFVVPTLKDYTVETDEDGGIRITRK